MIHDKGGNHIDESINKKSISTLPSCGEEVITLLLQLLQIITMPMTAVFVPIVVCFQQLQHLQHSGLQGSAQVAAAVWSAERRHVDEGGAAFAQVQRGVVGVVAQIPARKPDSGF